MALPSNVSYGHVTGKFLRAVADSSDTDLYPDGQPLAGLTIKFTASVTRVKNVTADPPVTIIIDPIVCSTNDDGVLVDVRGNPGVWLVASSDEDLNPTGWTWTATFYASSITYFSTTFALAPDQEVDLATLIPVPSSPGTELAAWQQVVAQITGDVGGAQSLVDAASASASAAAVSATKAAEARDAAETFSATTVTLQDAAVKSLIVDDSSETRSALGAVIQPVDVSLRVRDRSRQGWVERVSLPTAFGWDAPLNVFKSGRSYFTDFDVRQYKGTAASDVYVDHVSGVSGAAGTEAAPVKRLDQAMSLVAAGGTIHVMSGGLAFRDVSWQNAPIRKSVNVVCEAGRVYYAIADRLTTWTSAGGGVYTATRSSVSRVVDLSIGRHGFGYTSVADLTECQTLPGSWYQSGSTLGVHTLTGDEPDPDVHIALLITDGWRADASLNDVSLYMEGMTILGGSTGNLMVQGGAGGHIDMYGLDVEMLWSTSFSFDGNSLNGYGARSIYLQRCVAANSRKDGFNYATPDASSGGVDRDSPQVIEVDCESYGHGIGNPVAERANSNNASTGHSGSKIVRIGGYYHDTSGPVVAETHDGTKSVNYSCVSAGSRATESWLNSSWAAAGSGAEMWLFDADSLDSQYDIYAVTGATVHVDDSRASRRTGAGTVGES